MVKVKIIVNGSHALVERDINEFLRSFNSSQNIEILIKDIKLSTSVSYNKEKIIAMIIYNETNKRPNMGSGEVLDIINSL